MRILYLSIFFMAILTRPCHSSEGTALPPLCEGMDYAPVSIYSLIVNPEKYRNVPVRVEGYFFASERSSVLFADKNSSKHYVFENAIKLEFDEQQVKKYEALNGTWKHLHGRFDVIKDRFGFYAGKLSKICFDEDWRLLHRNE